jgi:REP element-mobilizing transposase RayT
MSRPLRIQYPDAWYHVMNRARRGQVLYPAKEDMVTFLDLLKETATMFNLKVSAYCLMPTHYHLLVQTPDANLDRCMRHLNGVYTQRYNVRNKCDGTLFRGRYKSILVDADTYLLELVRYIHRNPLRAGLADKIDAYAWSSHQGYLSDASEWGWLHKDFVLKMLARYKAVQIKKYKQFVGKQDAEHLVSVFEKANLPSMLGGKVFIKWVKANFFKGKIHKDVPQTKLLAPARQGIIQVVCDDYEVAEKDLMAVRRGVVNEPRDMAIYLLRTVCGEPLMKIGATFGMARYSSVSSAVDRIKTRQANDAKLAKRVSGLLGLIKKGQTETWPPFQVSQTRKRQCPN